MRHNVKQTKPLRLEDKIILGIAGVVALSAISIVGVGGSIFDIFTARKTKTPTLIEQASQDFKKMQNEFSQNLARSMNEMEESYRKQSAAHEALMREKEQSLQRMSDALENHMNQTHKQMEDAWQRGEAAILKEMNQPLEDIPQKSNMRKRDW